MDIDPKDIAKLISEYPDDDRGPLFRPPPQRAQTPEPEMTVGQLVQALGRHDPGAPVGIAYSETTGYVNKIAGIKVAGDGTVVIDMSDETIGGEEMDIL